MPPGTMQVEKEWAGDHSLQARTLDAFSGNMVTRSATAQRRGSQKRAASGQCLLAPVVKGEASKFDNASGSLAPTIDCPESQTNDILEARLGAGR